MEQDNNHTYRHDPDNNDQRKSPSTDQDLSTDPKNRPGAKARASRAGTRSVSTLNAEQLARKRANDREAQRAIRQRTREHIERLENRIKELSENTPEADATLEAVERRNAELEEELRQLRNTLFGMAEGSSSPSTSHQHLTFNHRTRNHITQPSYSPQSSWVPQMGFHPLPPTSNPIPEADPSWQSQIPTHNQRRTLSHQLAPGFQQQISWSRTESSDSDYDSGLGNQPDLRGSPVGVYPDQMHNYAMQGVQIPRHGIMWQTPTSSSGSNTPYEAHQQLPNMPNLPHIPRSRSNDQRLYSMKHQQHLGYPGNSGSWGPPSPHDSDV